MKFCIFFVLGCPSFLFGIDVHYIEVKSIHQVAGDILHDKADFCLILDLDDTLLQGGEALSHSLWQQKTIEQFQKLGLTEREAWETVTPYWIEIQHMGSVKPIEPTMSLLISKLQDQGKAIFAYTERPKTTKDLTLKQLQAVSVSLEATAPQLKLSLPDQLLYHSGVLFSEELHKGPGLQCFLEGLILLPKKIIYIDNNKENVMRIGELCRNYGIVYFGIIYKAQQFSSPIYLPEIAKIQYTYSKKLLSNDAAALLLRHQMEE
ncbi:DUF2608 domain-containing protein [Candidatus Chlamydia sanziniae]|uniref:Uncharacterized protein n=1 Tax=Candidatus Chlamydia sanziniae TaxID=1806891 RepID=A0A1A9HY26_9CHLA|nr:DUF2608 domain-containing protein [Candidatus Chlamydia sanziniae]ANH78826.1 hypothetical protein Cs308_0656 [Candidatus Chlamydia sanziniae]